MNDDRDITKLPMFGSATSTPTTSTNAASHLLAAVSTPTASPAPTPRRTASTPSESVADADAVDWDHVRRIRDQVSEFLSETANRALGEQARQEKARALITDVIREMNESIIGVAGEAKAWNSDTQSALARAAFDSLFRLGRIQPLIDDPEVENVDIHGFDNVYVQYSDGRYVKKPNVANSDLELMNELQFIASRGGEAGRSFSAASPDLDLELPGGARLAAVAPPISPRPKAVIRVHRFIDITLEQMVEKGTLTSGMAHFISVAVRAGCTFVVAGSPAAGKTTLLRAMCNAIDPYEPIVTIEKERELHLDRMGERHHLVTALQYRTGQGERAADGSSPGAIDLVQLLEKALRLNTERVIVGEVRGGEIDAMFQAMQAGVGTLSTIHASSATDAIERMATLVQKVSGTTDAYAYRQIAQHIDFIIHVVRRRGSDGKIRRYITEVSEVVPGETNGHVVRPNAVPIFRTNRLTGEHLHGEPLTSSMLEVLVDGGLDERVLRERDVA